MLTLKASDTASQSTLQTLFEQKRKALQSEIDSGNQSAKRQLWALNAAYGTLSNPDKRATYDQSLRIAQSAPIAQRAISQKPTGMSWKMNSLLIALLTAGLVGFGLQLGRANKKDEITTQVLQINRAADNDATRAATERTQVDGRVQNEAKAVDAQSEVANRIVGVSESAESRAARELEYRANAGAEILRQQRERLRIENEQLKWERQQSERALATRQGQDQSASLRMEAIQLAISNGRLVEARSYARTPQESAMVARAEQAAAAQYKDAREEAQRLEYNRQSEIRRGQQRRW